MKLATRPSSVAAQARKAAQEALSAVYKAQPSARKAVESAAGYAAFSNFGMKILIAGGNFARRHPHFVARLHHMANRRTEQTRRRLEVLSQRGFWRGSLAEPNSPAVVQVAHQQRVARGIHARGDRPQHLRPVARVDVVVDDDHELGESEPPIQLANGPEVDVGLSGARLHLDGEVRA